MFVVNELENGVCGGYDLYSLQQVVAVTWFLDRLNEADYVPGIKIGLDAYRTCRIPEQAARGADSMLNKYSVGRDTCGQNNHTLLGMLGPSRTAEAMVVSRLFGLRPREQRLLQVSGSATGRELSDKAHYPTFFRVIPPDTIQVQVMLELLEQLDWNYVAIVYDEDDYGRSAATELRRLAEDRQICVPLFESMPVDTRSDEFYTRTSQIAEQIGSTEVGLVRGLVVLGSRRTTKELLSKLNSEVSYIQPILSEAIALQSSSLQTAEGHVIPIARGTLLTSPQYSDLPEFRTFWNQLWADNHTYAEHASRNPWLAGYLQQLTGCDAGDSGCWENAGDKRASLSLADGAAGGGLSLYLWYKVKAIAVMASFLKRLHAKTCGSSFRGVCAALTDAINDRERLLTELKTDPVPLSDLANVTSAFQNVTSVAFDANGDVTDEQGDDQYTVYNFRRGEDGFAFKQVGALSNSTLTIQTNLTEFYNPSGDPLTWSELPPAQCDVNHNCVQCEHDVSGDVIFVEGDFYVVAIVPVHSKDPSDALHCGEIQTVAGADLAEAVVFAVQQINAKVAPIPEVLPGRRVGLVVINSCSSPLLVRQRLLDLHSGRLILPDGRTSSFIVPYIMGYVGAYISGNSIAVADTLNLIGKPFVQVSAASTSQALKDRTKYPYFMRLATPDDTQARVLLDVVVGLGANYIQIIYDSTTTYGTSFFSTIQDEINHGDRYNVCIAQGIPATPREDSTQYSWIVDKLRTKPSARVVIVVLHLVEIEKAMDAILPLLTSSDNFVFLATNSWGRRYELIERRPKLEGSMVLSQELVPDASFQAHFSALDPTVSQNPWLKYFWEKRGNCFFDKSFQRKGKSGPCSTDFGQDYSQDPRAPFHIKAVYSLVLGFSRAMSQYCGPSATRMCEALTSERLVETMHRVGQWTQDGLALDKADLTLPGGSEFTSVCPNEVECKKCFSHQTPPPPVEKSEIIESDPGVTVEAAAGAGAYPRPHQWHRAARPLPPLAFNP
ncbi:hypothetical protein BaRGS_00008179, partial [Batillaria attramentaria]